MTGHPKNEGEGSRTAAKDYDERTQRFVDEEDVEAKAEEAREAVEQDDEGKLSRSGKAGKREGPRIRSAG